MSKSCCHGGFGILKSAELELVLEIPISFENRILNEFEMYKGTKEPYYEAIVSVYLTCSDGSLVATVVWNNSVIFSTQQWQRM